MELLTWLASVCVLALAHYCQGYTNFGIDLPENVGTPLTSCDCGWVNGGNGYNGTEVREDEYPMMVYVLRSKTDGYLSKCGGSIITPWHVLTAAHCTNDISGPNSMTIFLGIHDMARRDHIRVPIAKVIVHRDYNRYTGTNDIAMLVTGSEIRFNQLIGPACIPPRKLYLEGQQLKTIGWARPADRSAPHVLVQNDLAVVSTNECMKYYGFIDPYNHLCTYRTYDCSWKGDFGSPLFWLDPDTGRYTVVSLNSRGRLAVPARINTDVSAFLHWIHTNIRATKPGVQACTKVSPF